MGGDLVGMVLCAGLGTRLRPLTDLLPKPAVPLGGLPLVRYPLALLAAAGARRAVVNVHHLAGEMERAARESAEALGLPLAISREPVLAGTGGALRQARGLLEGAAEIVVINGDVLFAADLEGALSAHRRSGALATMLLAPMPPGGYAPVEADAGLAVRRIAGLGPGGDRLASWHFTGCHVLSPSLLDLVPAEPFACDLNRHLYPPLLSRPGGSVRGYLDAGTWRDLGSPAGYLEAHLDLLEGRLPLGAFPGADPLGGLTPAGPGLWLGPGATVDPAARLEAPAAVGAGSEVESGAQVGPGAFVGRACLVGRGATVRRAVVWDGTAVGPGERVEGAVAADRLRVTARASAPARR